MNAKKQTRRFRLDLLERLQRRFQVARPGSVLLFVVVLLVLLALMATAFLSTARLDRMYAQQHVLEVERGQLAGLLNAILARTELTVASIPSAPIVPNSLTSPQVLTDGVMPSALYPGTTAVNGLPAGAFLAASLPQLLPDNAYQTGLGDGAGKPATNYVQSDPTRTTTKDPIVVWRNVSLVGTTLPESPYNTNAATNLPLAYPQSANAYQTLCQSWWAPTSVVISYPTQGSFNWPPGGNVRYNVNPNLVGRTRVFPAFDRWYWSGGTFQKDANGPYLAADSTGSGIADSVLIPFSPSQANQDNDYYAVRIVDNAAAINANTSFGQGSDIPTAGTAYPWSTGSGASAWGCQNFFPSDNDGIEALWANGMDAPAINKLQNAAHSYTTPTGWSFLSTSNNPLFPPPPAPAPNGVGAETTSSDEYWHDFGSRLNNCGGAGRPFSNNDTACLRYHGVMVTALMPQSALEQATYPVKGNPDSFFYMSINGVANQPDWFNFVPANQPLYWYDWSYNWDGYQIPETNLNASGLNLSSKGLYNDFVFNVNNTLRNEPFRTPRTIFVANNPVVAKIPPPISTGLNAQPMRLPTCVMPAPTGAAPPIYPASQAPYTMSVVSAPVRVSLNTPISTSVGDQFPDLWRQFWLAMSGPPDLFTEIDNATPPLEGIGSTANPSGPPATLTPWYEYFHVAGDAALTPDTGSFRPTFRDPNNTAVKGPTPGQWQDTNQSTIVFDKWNQLLLRAAIAAVNVEQFRYSAGNKTGSDIQPGAPANTPFGQLTSVCLARKITLRGRNTKTNAYGSYDVLVNADCVQPFITEVYANTDQTSPTAGSGSPNINTGYVGIELYNPYNVPINLNGYRLGLVNRATGSTGVSPAYQLTAPVLVGPTTGAYPLDGQTIQPLSTLLLENYNSKTVGAGLAGGRPAEVGTPAGATLPFPYLGSVFAGATTASSGTSSGGELILFRPHNPLLSTQTTAADGCYNETTGLLSEMVPCDSYDFTGMSLTNSLSTTAAFATAWHYLRDNSTSGWKFVYPGPYNPGSTQAPDNLPLTIVAGSPPTGLGVPRQYKTSYTVWNPTPNTSPTWFPNPNTITTNPGVSPKVQFGATHTGPFNNNNFPPVQLYNDSFGGPNKYGGGQTFQFPFGGFARIGDLLQVPFIGSYTVYNSGTTNLIEINPVTMDCAFSDDGDPNDDTVEFLGHFTPIDLPAAGYDDYNPNGDYSPATRTSPPDPTTSSPLWKYRWAMHVLDYFTVVNNPADDYQPNCDFGYDPNFGASYRFGPKNGIAAGVPVQNITGVAGNNHTEDYVGTEGLVNINTASWKVLSMIQMIPLVLDTNGAQNRKLAKCIVRYRDFDDGLIHMVGGVKVCQGHGPFQSLMELNRVFDPTTWNGTVYTGTFQNGLGLLATSACPSLAWGNLQYANNVQGDFQAKMMMVNRISNMVTLRSDSFTAYALVQQWHNLGTPWPELVHQSRGAMILDRTQVPAGSIGATNSLQMSTIPTN